MSQAPQFYRFTVGDARITAFSDGSLPISVAAALRGGDPAVTERSLASAFLADEVETSINVYLIEVDGHRILVDTGAGELMRGDGIGGALQKSMAAAGVTPESITDILVTHMHHDHAGGLTIGGQRVFPKATVHAGKPDAEFFLDPEVARTSTYRSPGLPRPFEEAVQVVRPYSQSGQLKPFDGTMEILPGLTGTVRPGHTPGSAFYTLTRQGQTIVFIGDTVHVAAVQLRQPAVTIAFDVDQPQAAKNRAAALSDLAKTRALVAGPHLAYPGVGHIATAGAGYRWVPVPYGNR